MWIAKIGAGFMLATLMLVFLPILDLLELFLWVVVVPITFLWAIGLVGDGLYEGITASTTGILRDLKNRVNEFRESMTSPEEPKKSL